MQCTVYAKFLKGAQNVFNERSLFVCERKGFVSENNIFQGNSTFVSECKNIKILFSHPSHIFVITIFPLGLHNLKSKCVLKNSFGIKLLFFNPQRNAQ